MFPITFKNNSKVSLFYFAPLSYRGIWEIRRPLFLQSPAAKLKMFLVKKTQLAHSKGVDGVVTGTPSAV